MTRLDVIKLIDSFLDGSLRDDYAWDDFVSSRFRDDEIEGIRLKVLEIELQYPAARRWCSDEGLAALKKFSDSLKLKSKYSN